MGIAIRVAMMIARNCAIIFFIFASFLNGPHVIMDPSLMGDILRNAMGRTLDSLLLKVLE
jgi:hypothetical protein